MAAVGVGTASRLLQGPMAPLRLEVVAMDRPMACMGLHLQVNSIVRTGVLGTAMPLPWQAVWKRLSRSCCRMHPQYGSILTSAM